jgi:ATP-grasp domain
VRRRAGDSDAEGWRRPDAAPLTRRGAAEMVRSLKTFPLLDGYRGAPHADVSALEELLLRISALAAAHPEIAELDRNPLLAGPGAATIVDARVRIEAPKRRRAPTLRWTADSEPRRRRTRVPARSGRAPRAMTGVSSAGYGRGATPRSAR